VAANAHDSAHGTLSARSPLTGYVDFLSGFAS
jgi:hypothetical protein